MKKIFEEYGGVIIRVIAIVALIAFVTFIMSSNGVIAGSFRDIVMKFVRSTTTLINSAANGAGLTLGTHPEEIEVPGLGTITVRNPNDATFTYDSESGILMGATPVKPVTPGEIEDDTPMIEFTAGTFEANTSYTPGEYELESYEVTKTRTKQPVKHGGGYTYSWIYVDGEMCVLPMDVSDLDYRSTYLAYYSVEDPGTTVNGVPGNVLHPRSITNAEDDTLENAIYLAAFVQKQIADANNGNRFVDCHVAKWNGTEYEDVDCREEIDAITDFTETYTETVTKTVVISRPSASTEYVYVPSGTMKAEEGMTWAKWLVSEYNTFGVDATTVWDEDYNEIDSSSEIEAGKSYGFSVKEGTNGSPWPISWNSTNISGNTSFNLGEMVLQKVSDYAPPLAELDLVTLTVNANVLSPVHVQSMGPCFLANFAWDDVEFGNDTEYAIWVFPAAGSFDGMVIPEAGLYICNPYGINADFTLALIGTPEGN